MTEHWLKGRHLLRDRTYTKFTLTIKEVDEEGHGRKYDNGKPIEGAVVRFKETDKEFEVKGTNLKLITAQIGGNPKHWPGQKVTLFPTVGDWFHHKNVLAIRVLLDADKPQPFIDAKHMGRPVIGVTVGSISEVDSDEIPEGAK